MDLDSLIEALIRQELVTILFPWGLSLTDGEGRILGAGFHG